MATTTFGSCTVGGDTLPLGGDDLHDLLNQYGEATEVWMRGGGVMFYLSPGELDLEAGPFLYGMRVEGGWCSRTYSKEGGYGRRHLDVMKGVEEYLSAVGGG